MQLLPCGEKSVSGRLRSQGIHIERQRVRDSMHRVDPSGVERRRRVLHRRQYNVESPNALARGWLPQINKMENCYGIDGYIRLIVSSSFHASTVLSISESCR
jgi:hypothetical protein